MTSCLILGGGVLGSRYPMKTAEVDGLKDVATDFGTTLAVSGLWFAIMTWLVFSQSCLYWLLTLVS